MASTGEVAAFGVDVMEAYWASLLSTNGFKIPKAGSGVLSVSTLVHTPSSRLTDILSHCV